MNLKENGYCYFGKKVHSTWVDKLKSASLEAIEYHSRLQKKINGSVAVDGLALNSLVNDDAFVEFVGELFDMGLIEFIEKEFFGSKFILNSFSSLNNVESNFSFNVHRDIKFYSGEIPIMLNSILMLDEFTEENGATKILPGSHKKELKPSDGHFQDNCVSLTGEVGTIALFNSNIWHCAAKNNTGKDRLAIAMTFSKSAIKQLFDYPRALRLRYNIEDEKLRQLFGYDSRVPASIEEWYGPNRMYKKDQD